MPRVGEQPGDWGWGPLGPTTFWKGQRGSLCHMLTAEGVSQGSGATEGCGSHSALPGKAGSLGTRGGAGAWRPTQGSRGLVLALGP